MNPHRRTLVAALALAPAFASFRAAGQPAFVELKPPLPVDANGKIEVSEFFWYGCIHCYNLEPLIEKWLPKLPSDAQFRRVPAVFGNPQMAHDAAIFYTFEALGVLDKMHRPFFDAIHKGNLKTANKPALGEWLQNNRIDGKKFEDTLKSFGVQSRVKRAQKLTADYQIDGTPAMGVHGRYTVSASDQMLDTVSKLIEAVRKQK